MKIANINDLKDGVNEIHINKHKFFITKNHNIIKIYDSICPHQGSILDYNCSEIYCKNHNWRFNKDNGNSINIKNAKLFEHELYIDDNNDIYLKNAIYNKKYTNTLNITPPPPIDTTISLHSHATLEFKRKDFTLICDPWIEGYAFFGAWRHYPKPVIKTKDLKPNAIFISHEHSDHFHIETLKQIDKNVAIYIPSFLNNRLEKKLKNLKFNNIFSVNFGECIKIANNFKITIYEPASIWNDAQILIEIDSFKILNMNDAGLNYRIHRDIGNVDCICAAFSPGASGYPATYTHLTNKEKINIYNNSKTATLDMLYEACKLYNARYFLPFASHFILNHPDHIKYMQIIQKNTINDVCRKFENSNIMVIDMLAGDSFDIKNNHINKLNRNKDLYNLDSIINSIKNDFNKKEFEKYYPNKQEYKFDKNIIFEYFEKLNLIPEMCFCENLSVTIYPDYNIKNAFSFEINNGILKILDSVLETPNLTIKIPSEILMYICKHNESWDEATIGYWCECSRNPDIYHTEFWRILQTPFYLKNPRINTTLIKDSITQDNNVADIMEKTGTIGSKIMSRYGLYCLSCNKAPMETLKQACDTHGINKVRMDRLVKELNIHYKNM